MEKEFVTNYIVKNKRKRILFELESKKRYDALGKFCHNANEYIDERKIIYRKDYLDEKEIKEYLEQKCYIISWDENYDKKSMMLKDILEFLVEEPMGMILIFGEHCIITTELDTSAKEIIIMKK